MHKCPNCGFEVSRGTRAERREKLRELAAQGMSSREIAKAMGVSSQAIWNLARRYGVKITLERRGAPRGARSIFHERNAAMFAAFEAGATLEAIGAQFGVTRERVRQICRRGGLEARRVSASREIAVLAGKVGDVSSEVFGVKAIAQALGVSPSRVKLAAKKHAVKIERDNLLNTRRAEIECAADKVAMGWSLAKAAKVFGLNRTSHAIISKICHDKGVVMAHGRWGRDYAGRDAIIRQFWGAESLSQICDRVSQSEGLVIGPEFVKRRAILMGLPMESARVVKLSAPRPRTTAKKRERFAVVLDGSGETVRERCVALRGIHTASEIAAALGITRNSVIGHWFRHNRAVEKTKQEVA